jgi:DNA-binding transcriptional ArsR family regulator
MKPPPRRSARLPSALGVPLRLRLLGALRQIPLTPAELAERLGADPETVVRHLEHLESLGLVVESDGGYAISYPGTLTDDDWEATPVPVRRSVSAFSLTQFHAAAAAAVDAGGFDRADIHLTRTALALDEDGWRRAVAVVTDTFDRLHAIDAPDDAEVDAVAILMLFEEGAAATPDAGPPDAATPDAEGRTRALDLADAIQRAVTMPEASWLDVVALAEQLRVVARAAALAPVPYEG